MRFASHSSAPPSPLPISGLQPCHQLPLLLYTTQSLPVRIRIKKPMGRSALIGIGGKDGGFQASHGTLPKRYLHICAWCAYCFKRVLAHREQDCLKKCKFIEWKPAQDAHTTPAVSPDCCLSLRSVVSGHLISGSSSILAFPQGEVLTRVSLRISI